MQYSVFQDLKLSRLGFGAMRLPVLEDGSINEPLTREMVAYAMANGVNYFDTAYPYHGGNSERVLGRALAEYDRGSFYLANKYPGHQIADSYDPAALFEEQLEKCGVDYFDFYLLHNVCENSRNTYYDPKWGIIDYFIEQKKQGRIRHLGFSSHAQIPFLTEFLDRYGEHMEFCQIQLNYLDWTLQNARGKYELLTERGIPVWVMEPVRGGKLANLSEEHTEKLRKRRPNESSAAWGFRFLQTLPNVAVVLSGMSDMDQMIDNVRTFSEGDALTPEESVFLLTLAERMKDSVPCTACRYCCEGCPMGLDIPNLISIWNEMRVAPSMNIGMRIDAMPENERPSACVACGACKKICPQNIDIPTVLSEFATALSKQRSWADICRERAEAAKKSKG